MRDPQLKGRASQPCDLTSFKKAPWAAAHLPSAQKPFVPHRKPCVAWKAISSSCTHGTNLGHGCTYWCFLWAHHRFRLYLLVFRVETMSSGCTYWFFLWTPPLQAVLTVFRVDTVSRFMWVHHLFRLYLLVFHVGTTPLHVEPTGVSCEHHALGYRCFV